MKIDRDGVAFLLVSVFLAGCARVTSQVVERERVDQELSGNRGYLAGSAPQAAAAHKSTRQMVKTDIELATLSEMVPWRAQKKVAAPPPEPAVFAPPTFPEETPLKPWRPEPEEELPAPVPPAPLEASAPASEAPTLYTVNSGDNLEKIAAKVYGDPNQWRRIYQANKDRIASPNRLYPGQKLAIPPAKEKEKREPRVGPGEDLK